MRHKAASAWLLCFLLVVFPSAEAQGGLQLFTVEEATDLISPVDPITGLSVSFEPITLSGETVLGASGLAKDPTTGSLYALLIVSGEGNVRRLVTVDPASGIANDIGPADNGTGLALVDITFSSDGVLYAVTDDGGIGTTSPETLFRLDKVTGSATPLKTLSNGGSGEAIVFNPSDNLLYHASGPSLFEKVDPGLPSLPVKIPLSVDIPLEATSLAHFGGDFFLLSDINGDAFLVHKNGSARFLSTFDHVPTGMAFTGSPAACPPHAALYGSAHQGSDGPALLYSIDPATGAASMIGPMGLERVGAMAFRNDGILFATGERMNGSNTTVLSTIDPCTGVATEIGPTGISAFTDLSFRPSDQMLFGMSKISQQAVRLATLDIGTGQATQVGLTGTSGAGNGIAFNADGMLFHADDFDLSTVNESNAALSFFAPLLFTAPGDNFPALNALDFQPGSGVLFASHNDGQAGLPENYLSDINTDTQDLGFGQVNIRGRTQDGLDGIAFSRSNVAPTTADLAITNVATPDPITAGNMITYAIVVTNNGPDAANDVVLSDQLPAALRNATATPQGQGSCSQGTTVLCKLGTINWAASVTVTVNATVVVSASGSITNTATVQSASSDPTPGNNSASAATTITPAPTADLAVTSLTHPPNPISIAVGGLASFTAVATNNGGASADAKLSFLFPVPMSSMSGLGCVSDSPTTITCDLGMLNSGQTGTAEIMAAAPFVRSIRPIVNVLSSLTNDTSGANNTRTDDSPLPLQVRPRPFARPGLGLRLP